MKPASCFSINAQKGQYREGYCPIFHNYCIDPSIHLFLCALQVFQYFLSRCVLHKRPHVNAELFVWLQRDFATTKLSVHLVRLPVPHCFVAVYWLHFSLHLHVFLIPISYFLLFVNILRELRALFVRVSFAVATIWRAFTAFNAYAAYSSCLSRYLQCISGFVIWRRRSTNLPQSPPPCLQASQHMAKLWIRLLRRFVVVSIAPTRAVVQNRNLE